MLCVSRPRPLFWTLGLSGNYPDGRTGNLPIIPFAHKNIVFAARTGLFYTVVTWIARRIFRIPTTILRCDPNGTSCAFFPHSGGILLEWVPLALCAILRPIIKRIQRFLRFFTPEEYITLSFPMQHRILALVSCKESQVCAFITGESCPAVSLPYI